MYEGQLVNITPLANSTKQILNTRQVRNKNLNIYSIKISILFLFHQIVWREKLVFGEVI